MIESVTLSSRGRSPVLVLAHFKGRPLARVCLSHQVAGELSAALKRPEATGELGAIVEAFPASGYERVLVVGLGERDGFDLGHLRDVAAAVARRLERIQAPGATICLAGPLGEAQGDENLAGVAFGEGLGLMAFNTEKYKGSASTPSARVKLVMRTSEHFSFDDFAHGVDFGLGLAESANVSRAISMAPPNICTTSYVASEATKLARKVGLKATVLKGKALEDNRLVGLINVGQASENEPCLIRLEYTPDSGRRRSKPVVLVGKTMTYDSGGLSIKVNNGMRGMKQDMDGGSAVLGAMHAIATVIRPRTRVVAYLSCAENSISDEAYRPDDIITYPNGVTVEVTNTDAEGRLVLADALNYACVNDNPAAIVDIATLTGGVVVALGRPYAGLFTDDPKLLDTLTQAGERTGERLWRLPLNEEYRKMMRAEVADIWNSAPVREAHPIQGAAFLSYFVKPGVPWAHIDIAGRISSKETAGPYAKGAPTGFGARLLADFIEIF